MRVTFRPHYAGKNGCYRSLWFSLNMKASRPGQPSAYLMTETGEGEELKRGATQSGTVALALRGEREPGL